MKTLFNKHGWDYMTRKGLGRTLACASFCLMYSFPLNAAHEPVMEDNAILSKQQVNQGVKKTVKGVVKDKNGETIIGANVVVKGTTVGVITDFDGNFTLEVPSDAILQVSYIGYVSQEIAVKGKDFFNIELASDTEVLDEVVVVGYGVQKKSSLTGSVATVSTDKLKKSSASNLSNALVGRMPGLIATSSSGEPGSGSKLLIRGQGTWNNSDPLVIVDGVERDFSYLDPNQIETISILKDAAASAVYGARAANGVILVTTKRGKEGKTTVTLDTYYGISSPTVVPELANAYEWATTRNKALLMNGASPDDDRIISDELIEQYRTGQKGTDWYKETFKDHASQYYANVNVSGGTENVKYFVSLGHHNEDAIVDGYNYQKYNLRSNIDTKITERLKLSVDIDANIRNLKSAGYSVGSLFGLVPRQNPTLEDYHPNGLPANTNGEHIIEMVRSTGESKTVHNDVRGNFKLEYKIPGIEGLTAKAMYSYGKNFSKKKNFFIPYKMYDVNEQGEITNTKVVGEKSTLNERLDQGSQYIFNVSLNYSNTFGKHDVGAMFLYEQEESDDDWFSAYRTNYLTNSIPQLGAGGDKDKDNDGSASEWARNGFVGRLNYSYDQKYFIEASFRYDGSITFPKGNRYGFFPSVSAAWRLSNESFISDNFEFINNLKLRASYGTLGNDNVDLWQHTSLFTYSSPATIGGANVNTIVVNNNLVANPDITWERSSTLDVGLEGTLWNGLLGFEIDGFYKRTKDILAPQIRTIPGTFGATLPDVNYGILDNKGFELVLTHRNTIGDFNYSVGGNFSFVKNKVIRFDESETTPEYYKVVGKSFTHSDNGRPYAGTVGMEALGFFQSQEEIDSWYPQFNGGQKPGDVKYNDVDGNGVVNENDLTIVDPYGSIPEIVYGFDFSVGWKGLELSVLFQGVAHKTVMLSGYRSSMFLDGSSNFYKYLVDDSWTPENTDAKYPRPYMGINTNNSRTSNIWKRKGDYLRLKNIELSYRLPQQIIEKIKPIEGVRFYVNGTNLLTFDALDIMDPESSGSGQSYPQNKTVNFGLNVSF